MAKTRNYMTRLDEEALHKYGNPMYNRRSQACMTQDDVAAKAGVSRSAVSRFERGSVNTTLFNAEAMLNAVGLTLTVAPMERGKGTVI